MEEKILIKSEQYDIGKACKRIFGIILLGVLIYCACVFYDGYTFTYGDSGGIKTGFEFIWFDLWAIILVLCGSALVLYLFYMLLSKEELVVSDKRVYGRVAFGRRVDLPIDSVSAVGMGAFKSIAVGTSSGRIYFGGIKNRDEIHTVISDLIIQRQNKPKTQKTEQSAPASNIHEELKKYKDLLDSGVITQEDFDAKKKQLLGL